MSLFRFLNNILNSLKTHHQMMMITNLNGAYINIKNINEYIPCRPYVGPVLTGRR